MSRNSILGKLQAELALDVTTECQVVYILVEIRKAIEQAGELKNYPALDFYCSFALHTRMDRTGARRILERFDKAHPLLINKRELPPELEEEIEQTTRLDRFRQEMKKFFISNDLPTRLVTVGWARFIHLYANIIDECELVLKSDSAGLQFIDRVVVHLETAATTLQSDFGHQMLFRICWTCHGKDGSCGDHYVIFGFDPKERIETNGRNRSAGQTGE